MRAKLNGLVTSNGNATIYRWFGYDVCCPNDVRKAIDECPEDEELIFEVNSTGGSEYAGFEMYSLIKGSGREVTAEVQSIAGSAASVFTAACSKVLMSPVGNFFVHRAAIPYTGGNEERLRQDRQMLLTIDESILNAYMEKVGDKATRTEVRHMMERETFMTPQQAVEKGFADGIMEYGTSNGEENVPALAIASLEAGTPPLPILGQLLQPIPPIEDLREMVHETGLNSGRRKEADVQNTYAEEREEEMEIKTADDLKKAYPDQVAALLKSITTIEDLQNVYPDLAQAVRTDAAKAERERITGIDAVAIPGFESIVSAAKADPNQNASTVAMAIIAKQKEQGVSYLNSAKADAVQSGANQVTPEAQPKDGEQDDPSAEAKAVADLWEKNRGVR